MSYMEKIEGFLDTGEDYPREPVPEDKRRSWVSIGLVWAGLYICIISILEGLVLIGGLSFKVAIAAQITGFLIFLTLMFIQGSIGTETGLSTYIIVRKSFGRKGSHLIALISFAGSFGWYAFQSRVMAESLSSMFNLGNIPLLSVVCGLLIMVTAIIGFRALEFISKPTALITFLAMIYIAIKSVLQSSDNFTELVSGTPIDEPMSFAAAISIIVGGMAIGVLQSPDVMRFSRSKKDNLKALYCFVLPVAIVQPIMSMIIGIYMNSTEIGYVLTTAGGFLGLLLVVLGTWTSNDNGLYSASLALSEILTKNKRWKMAIITGVLASVISAIIDITMYEGLMYFFSSIAVPVLGITIADYYVLPKVGLKRNLAEYWDESINLAALSGWVIGAIFSALTDFGFISNPYNIPVSLVSILLTGTIYIILMKIKVRNKKIAVNSF